MTQKCGRPGVFADALRDHQAADDSQLEFRAGDVIEVTQCTDGAWWWGRLGMCEGWFPSSYAKVRLSIMPQ